MGNYGALKLSVRDLYNIRVLEALGVEGFRGLGLGASASRYASFCKTEGLKASGGRVGKRLEFQEPQIPVIYMPRPTLKLKPLNPEP